MIQQTVCPFCAQRIEVHVDMVRDGDSWIEDCEVCCHPIKLTAYKDGSGRYTVSAEQE